MDVQNRIWTTQLAGLYWPRAHNAEEEYLLGKQLNGAWMLQ